MGTRDQWSIQAVGRGGNLQVAVVRFAVHRHLQLHVSLEIRRPQIKKPPIFPLQKRGSNQTAALRLCLTARWGSQLVADTLVRDAEQFCIDNKFNVQIKITLQDEFLCFAIGHCHIT